MGCNSLFGVGNLVLDGTFIVSASTVRTSTLFVLGFDVVVAELTYLRKINCQYVHLRDKEDRTLAIVKDCKQ